MSVAEKKLLTERVLIRLGSKSRPQIFEVPKKAIKGLLQILESYPALENEGFGELVPSEQIFPDLADPATRAATALRGARYKEGFTQKALASKLGIKQGDLSKMENAKRPIGKKMAKRLAEVLRIDYRVFLEH